MYAPIDKQKATHDNHAKPQQETVTQSKDTDEKKLPRPRVVLRLPDLSKPAPAQRAPAKSELAKHSTAEAAPAKSEAAQHAVAQPKPAEHAPEMTELRDSVTAPAVATQPAQVKADPTPVKSDPAPVKQEHEDASVKTSDSSAAAPMPHTRGETNNRNSTARHHDTQIAPARMTAWPPLPAWPSLTGQLAIAIFFIGLLCMALLIFGGPGDKKKVDTAGKEPASDEHVVATVDKHHAHDHAKSSKPSRSPKVPATAVKPNTVNEPEHSKELTPPNLAGLEVKESEDVKDESAAATAPSDAAEVSEQVAALPSGRGEPHDSHENLGHDELTTEKAAEFADSGTRPPINWPPQPQPYVYPETDPSTFKYPAFGDAPRIGRGMDQPRSADGSQRNGRQEQNTATLRGTIDPLPYGVQR